MIDAGTYRLAHGPLIYYQYTDELINYSKMMYLAEGTIFVVLLCKPVQTAFTAHALHCLYHGQLITVIGSLDTLYRSLRKL